MTEALSRTLYNKDTVRKNFSRAASTYDEYAVMQKFAARRLSELVERSFPKQCGRVWEIGCGTGLLTTELLSRLEPTHYLATDVSLEMLQECQRKALSADAVLEFKQADGERFDAVEQCDLIVSGMTAQWMDLASCLSLWCQAPVKRIAFSTLLNGSLSEWQQAVKGSTLPLLTRTELQTIVNAQSIVDAEIVYETHSQTFPDVRDFLHSLRNIGAHSSGDPVDTASLRRAIKKFPDGFCAEYHLAMILIEVR